MSERYEDDELPHEADQETQAAPPGPPRRQAAALHYQAGDRAPQIVATGQGYIAEQIIAAAREGGVPVRQDPALAKALTALELGSEVPEALYRAVAETLAWAYRLDSAAADRARREPRP
jgi:flagellar biosynthesis protein